MKKSRVFIAASTLVLVVASVVATKASNKFLNPKTIYFGSSNTILLSNCSGTSVLYTSPSLSTLRISGSTGSIYTIQYHGTGASYWPVQVSL